MNTGEITARFKGRLKRVKHKFEQKVSSQQRVMFNLSGSLNQDDIRVKVNLPKIQLPNCDGNIQQWTEFWEMFSTAVDQQNLSKISKFTYLEGVLKGAAATAISGIAITSDNYDLVVSLLKERFTRYDAIIESLYV